MCPRPHPLLTVAGVLSPPLWARGCGRRRVRSGQAGTGIQRLVKLAGPGVDADPGQAGGKTMVQAAHPQCRRVAEGCRAGRWGPDCSEACSGAPTHPTHNTPTPTPAPAPRAQAGRPRCRPLPHRHLPVADASAPEAAPPEAPPHSGPEDGDGTRQVGLGPGPAPWNCRGPGSSCPPTLRTLTLTGGPVPVAPPTG